MRVSASGNLIVETARRGVRVMRFARPDLRQYLEDAADGETSLLFREIQDAVLSDLPKGWTFVVNLGLIDHINAAFYGCLLQIRKCVQVRHGRLVLCGLSPWHQEVFDLFRGPELFTIVGTEAEARRDVRGQEVFLAVSRKLADFYRQRPADSFRGWLRTITSHKPMHLASKQSGVVRHGEVVRFKEEGNDLAVVLADVFDHLEGLPYETGLSADERNQRQLPPCDKKAEAERLFRLELEREYKAVLARWEHPQLPPCDDT